MVLELNRSCLTCEAYAALARQCRAEPPRAVPIGMTAGGEPIVLGTWPPVEPGDWCMQWAARPEED